MPVNEIDDLQTSTFEKDLETVVQFNDSEPIHFTNSCHSIQLLEDLQSLRNNEELCDVKFETNNGTIVIGHKNVLVAASKYFHDMFSSGDYNNKVVIIRDLDSSVLQILIDYIYTGKIKVTYENVKVLLPAANILQLDYVSSACVEYLQKYIDASNCLSIKAFADLHKCTALMSSSEAFIKKNFLEMIKGNEFILLTCEKVIELISCNDIAVPSEEKIFECVIKWIKHDLDSRDKFLPQLMEHVRLPLLAATPNILYNIIEEPLLKNCPKYNDIVSEALHFYLLKSVQYFTIPQSIPCKPRQLCTSKKIILLFKFSKRMSTYKTDYFDPATNLSEYIAEINDCHQHIGIGVIRDQIVFAMGGGNKLCSQSVSMLDVLSLSPCWVPMADMLVGRRHLGVGVLDDSIYAIGGVDSKSNVLSSVEVFDVNIQKWRLVTSMNTERSNFGVGVLSGRLYAVGGHDCSYILKAVECYDPTHDTWTPVADLSICREGVSVGVLNGVMYAVGGNGVNCLRSVEAYRPSDGIWLPIADMHLDRYKPGVVALDGLLYVFGGVEESNYFTMEVYDPNTNIWSIKKINKGYDNVKLYGGVVVNSPSNFTIN